MSGVAQFDTTVVDDLPNLPFPEGERELIIEWDEDLGSVTEFRSDVFELSLVFDEGTDEPLAERATFVRRNPEVPTPTPMTTSSSSRRWTTCDEPIDELVIESWTICMLRRSTSWSSRTSTSW